MLRIFWDKDNIAFISNQVKSASHSHCVLQVFLSLGAPLQVKFANDSVNGKCIVVNKNVKHSFSCNNAPCLSILIEPSSNFAKELSAKMNGDYIIYEKENLEGRHRSMQHESHFTYGVTPRRPSSLQITRRTGYEGVSAQFSA